MIGIYSYHSGNIRVNVRTLQRTLYEEPLYQGSPSTIYVCSNTRFNEEPLFQVHRSKSLPLGRWPRPLTRPLWLVEHTTNVRSNVRFREEPFNSIHHLVRVPVFSNHHFSIFKISFLTFNLLVTII